MDKLIHLPDSRLWGFSLIFGLAVYSFYLVWGAVLTPFHPDESTQLFMSSDFELLLKNPGAMAWSQEYENDPRQRYRELDAPLTRYLLGVGRALAGLPALTVDWDWSKTWEENQAQGAVPDSTLLLVGRLTISLLLPFSLILIYQTGKTISGSWTGLIAALLLGFHTLILLHARRAMAEGALTLGLALSLWSFLQGDRRPWLAALGVALAFNAKQSALVLLPVGMLAVTWFPGKAGASSGEDQRSTKVHTAVTTRQLANLAQLLVFFLLITYLLNPFLWRSPIQALQSAWVARQDLLQQQLSDAARLATGQALYTPGDRLVALLANLYLLPPSFYEVGNYQDQTADAEEVYLAVPGHNLLRGLVGGGVFFVLTILGIILSAFRLKKCSAERRRQLVLLLLATGMLLVGFLITVPLPWQRYVIPLVPLVCLWSASSVGIKLDEMGENS